MFELKRLSPEAIPAALEKALEEIKILKDQLYMSNRQVAQETLRLRCGGLL